MARDRANSQHRAAALALAGLAIVLAAFGFWLMLVEHDPGPAPFTRGDPTDRPRIDAMTGTGTWPTDPDQPAVRQVALPADLVPVITDATRVRVVRWDDGTGVAGAEVWFGLSRAAWQSAPLERRRDLFERRSDRVAILRETGTRTFSDSDGWFDLPAVAGTHDVVAMRDGMLGLLNLGGPAPADGWQLVVAPETTAEIRVVGPNGEPVAGVPIGLVDPVGNAPGPRRSGLVGATSRDGSLVVHPARHGRGIWKTPVRAFVLGPGLTSIAAELVPGQAAAVTLTLPPTGRVALRPGTAWEPNAPLREVVLEDSGDGAGIAGLARRGEAVTYPFVALGGTLRASSEVGLRRLTVEARGPVRAGQTVVIDLDLEPGTAVLAGRVWTADAIPLSYRWLSLRKTSVEIEDHCQVETDLEGRFAIAVDDDDVGREVIWTLALLDRDGAPTGAAAEIRPGTLWPGRRDVGDVVLSPPPLVLGARIVAQNGKPVATAWLVVERLHSYDPNREPTWRRDSSLRVHRTDDGRIEVRGTPGPGPLRARAYGPDLLPHEPVHFLPGTQDLTLTVARGATVTAEILVDKALGTRADNLSATLRRIDNAAVVPPNPPTTQGERWSYRWRAVPPGAHRLELRAVGERAPRITREPIEVAGDDVRLDTIDLRGVYRSMELTFIATTGESLANAQGLLLPDPPADEAGGTEGFRISGGRAHVVTSEPTIGLRVLVDGYRPRSWSGPVEDATVLVQPAMPVRVTVAELTRLPFGVRASVSLDRVATDGDAGFGLTGRAANRYTLDDRGSATVPVADAGEHDIVVWLLDTNGLSMPRSVAATPSRVALDWRDGGHEVTVRIDAERVRAVVERLQSPR